MEEPVSSNSGGRPKKPEAEKRSVKKQTHFTPAEADDIELKCSLAGITVAEFLRELALDHEVKSKANPEALKKIRAEIGKIGSNINQIAKKVNQGELTDTSETNFRELVVYLHKKLEEL